ncbi:carboxylesterase/lipase family protein [Rhodococcoides kroppenstedtii]|uniref:carboxylesterase/lipase family protein n=1 Tax=Rhodococcoides kroppenstedtii TaxID=293050 RepID=UPI00363592DB
MRKAVLPALVLAAASAMVAACSSSGAASPSTTNTNTVETGSGLVSGERDGSVQVFRGIPYAEAPVGDLRWRSPQPVQPWSGVRSATDFGAGCTQIPNETGFEPYGSEFFAKAPFSEDCLFLNVWTNGTDTTDKPVLVWFHGGGFYAGSGSDEIFNGASLAARDAVVVTVNYRLGALGYLAHPDLSSESAEGVSGNYGLLDQVAALEWVRQNISNFGGDSANVTIAGQSAGAASVNALLVSPSASGLFHRAIAQSGPAMGVPPIRLNEAEGNGEAFATALGAPRISDMRALAPDLLARAALDPTVSAGRPVHVPIIDERVLPVASDDPESMPASDVPILAGYNANEITPVSDEVSPDDFSGMVRQRYGDSAERMLELYPHENGAEATESWNEIARDRYMASLLTWADGRRQRAAESLFLYQFDHAYPIPQSAVYKSFHTAEVPYVFGTLDAPDRAFTPKDGDVRELMQSTWLAFMKSGNPTTDTLAWSPSGADENVVARLGASPGTQRAVSTDERMAAFRDYVSRGGTLSLF